VIKIILLLFLTASASSSAIAGETIQRMANSVFIPENTITIDGVDNNGVKYSLEYNREKDSLKETIGDNSKDIPGNEIEPFLRLFFFKGDTKKPDTLVKSKNMLIAILEKLDIDVQKSVFSVSDADNSITIAIGKSKRFENAGNLQVYRSNFLPAALIYGNRKVLFSDYHKSVLPLAFPGRIDIFEDGELLSTVFFLRKEYR